MSPDDVQRAAGAAVQVFLSASSTGLDRDSKAQAERSGRLMSNASAPGSGRARQGDARDRGSHPAAPWALRLRPRTSSGRGAETWRAAARWPDNAARWSDAGRDRPAARAANHPTRKPASNASPAPVVSFAAMCSVATSNRSRSSPSRARTVAPCGPRLTTATAAKSSRPVVGIPTEERLRLRGRREHEVRGDVIDERAGCPPTAREQRADAGEVDADRWRPPAAQVDRPAPGEAQGLAEQRVDRQVDGVGARNQAGLEVGRGRAGRRRRGPRRTSARHPA